MLIGDLHIHSKFARATSRDCVPERLSYWARKKGIGLVGTGDFTHPAWRDMLREQLTQSEAGLYTLKPAFAPKEPLPPGPAPRFVVSGEISCIYKQGGRVRKAHHLILLPSLEAADRLASELSAVGNIQSDGRPIFGVTSRDLLDFTLTACPEAIFIPAHIWTPHFSMLGAYSGFDTLKECFLDLSPHIHALETGLSSDPSMNWRLSMLDGYALVSNSDAHSPEKLGREANLLDIPLSYAGLYAALSTKEHPGLLGTLEFFPEEGKYHYDGHRNCDLVLAPEETRAAGGVCPVCGKPVTKGVLYRVEELADRAEGTRPKNARPYESLAPLKEVIGASIGVGGGKRVDAVYEALLARLGPELYILREASLSDIALASGPLLGEGVRRLREKEVRLSPGFDGEYGKVTLFTPEEIKAFSGQLGFFPALGLPKTDKKAISAAKAPAEGITPAKPGSAGNGGLNEAQWAAATATEPVVAVAAGPGTGKTKTLVSRILYLIETGTPPEAITAVTFTNKAAKELRVRLEQALPERAMAKDMNIGTFHSICLSLLRGEKHAVVPALADQATVRDVAKDAASALGLTVKDPAGAISMAKNGLGEAPKELLSAYQSALSVLEAMDFDDLLIRVLEKGSETSPPWAKRFAHLLVDEFQDCNRLQYRLVRAWSRESRGLFVIGDPDQSIYGFRGSDPCCFQNLLRDLPGAREIRLTENYRSTPEILACALPVIEAGGGGESVLTPMAPPGMPVRFFEAGDSMEEGKRIAEEISRLTGGVDMLSAHGDRNNRQEGAWSFGDMAVLYRTHHQARALEDSLGAAGIPYTVAGRDRFLTEPRVREALAFFTVLYHPGDLLALRRTLGAWGLCVEPLLAKYGAGRRTMRALIEMLTIAGGREAALGAFYAALLPRAKKDAPEAMLELWLRERGLRDEPGLSHLRRAARMYRRMPELLENLLLGQEPDVVRTGPGARVAEAVTLMTLHGAKGLEFPVVFLSGLSEGLLPLAAGDPAEERRLCYVGMTRAKSELILSAAGPRSSFLSPIPPDRLLFIKGRRRSGKQLVFPLQ